MNDDLKGARQRIDALDEKIQGLIAERARVAQTVRDIKVRSGDEGDHYRPAREAEVLKRAMQHNREIASPLPDETMAKLMREIMSACLALESPLSVAYLGPEGTYTQAAVYKHFGQQVAARASAAIDEIFRDVESGAAAYGVVPIENSTEGVVTSTLDSLAGTPLTICGEVWLPVHHQLLSKCERLDQITTIYSHSQSFGQCRRWLDNKLPNIPREVVASNGFAAKKVAEKIAESAGEFGAAIAGAMAAELYGLRILAANIEDDPNNTTRFLVIGRQNPESTGADKTSIVVSASTNSAAGALHGLLEPFAKAGINLTKIESRPSRRAAWDYNIFLDLEGHRGDAKVSAALEEVRGRAGFFKILGAYPRAIV